MREMRFKERKREKERDRESRRSQVCKSLTESKTRRAIRPNTSSDR